SVYILYYLTLLIFVPHLYFSLYRVHRDLHSFPTRRSSDLITVANAFRRNQRALRIQSFEYVFEALALFPDQVLFGDFQVLEEELIGLVIHHIWNRTHGQALANRLSQINDEDRHAFRFLLDLGQWRGARQQNHEIGMLHARDPDLLAVHHVTPVFLYGRRLQPRSIGAGGRLGDRHRLDPELACSDGRQIFLFLLTTAAAQQSTHVVHLAVHSAGVPAAAIDLFHDHGRRGKPQPRPAELLRDHGR